MLLPHHWLCYFKDNSCLPLLSNHFTSAIETISRPDHVYVHCTSAPTTIPCSLQCLLSIPSLSLSTSSVAEFSKVSLVVVYVAVSSANCDSVAFTSPKHTFGCSISKQFPSTFKSNGHSCIWALLSSVGNYSTVVDVK